MSKTINIPIDQHDQRLLTVHRHITASLDALAELDKALISANQARTWLYNATHKNFPDSKEAVEILRRTADEIEARLKAAEGATKD